MPYRDEPIDQAQVDQVRAKLVSIELAELVRLRAERSADLEASLRGPYRSSMFPLRESKGLVLLARAPRAPAPRADGPKPNWMPLEAERIVLRFRDHERALTLRIVELAPPGASTGAPDARVAAAALATELEGAVRRVRAVRDGLDELARAAAITMQQTLVPEPEGEDAVMNAVSRRSELYCEIQFARAALAPFRPRTSPWIEPLERLAQTLEGMRRPDDRTRDGLVRAVHRLDDLLADLDQPN